MARVVLTPTEVDRFGVVPPTPVNSDSTNQQQVANDGKVDVTVNNADASTRNVTFWLDGIGANDGATVQSKTYPITAGQTKSFYGFPVSLYGTTLRIDTDNVLLKLAVEHKVSP
jgi:hypothetical protein